MTDAKIHGKDHPQYPIKEQKPLGPQLKQFLKKYGVALIFFGYMFVGYVLPRIFPP